MLTAAELAELHSGIDRTHRYPTAELTHHSHNGWSFVRLFEREFIFRDLLIRDPMISLGEVLIGPNCHRIVDGAIYNSPGKEISKWHVDGGLYFPLPDDTPHHDPSVKILNLIVNFQMMLTDVTSLEYGPT